MTYSHYSDVSVNGKVTSSKQGLMIGSVTVMPTASADYAGQTLLYTGATSGGYVKNTMYTCTQDGSSYSWVTAISPAADTSGLVPGTRTVNGKALSSNITLDASDVGAIDSSYGPKTTLDGTKDTEIPTSKAVATAIASAVTGAYKVQGSKTVAQISALTDKVQGDVYNVTDTGTITGGPAVHAGDNVVWTGSEWDKLAATLDLSGYVQTSRKVNGKALTSDITLSASDVGALASDGTAAKATADASGNNIADIYATKTTVPSAYQAALTFDSSPTASSTNPVTSGGVYTAVSGKQDALTFDSAPTLNSTNPVTSGGVYNALANIKEAETWVISDISSPYPTFTCRGVTKTTAQFGEYVYANYTDKTIYVTYSQFTDPDDADAIIFQLDYVRMREESEVPAYQVRFTQSVSNFPIYYITLTGGMSQLGMINLQTQLTFDSAPTASSTNPVTSGGVYTALANISTSGFQVTAESGYYTLTDGNNVTLTNNTTYWTLSWS